VSFDNECAREPPKKKSFIYLRLHAVALLTTGEGRGQHCRWKGKQPNTTSNDIVSLFLEVRENVFDKGNNLSLWLVGIQDPRSASTALCGKCTVSYRRNLVENKKVGM